MILLALLVGCLLSAQQSPGDVARELSREGWRLLSERNRSSFEAAREKFERALALARQENDDKLVAYVLHSIGAAQAALGDPAGAEEPLRQALSMQRRLPDRAAQASTADRLAAILNASAKRDEALALQLEALAIRRDLNDLRGQAQTLTNIGLTYAALGRRQAALDHYAQGLPLWKQIGEAYGQATTLHNMAETYVFLGDWRTAVEHAKLALPLHQSGQDWPGYAHTLIHLGEAGMGLGDTAGAIAYLRQALSISRQRGFPWLEVSALLELAEATRKSGQRNEARSLYKNALEQIQRQGQRQREASAVLGLAETEAQPAAAMALFERSLALSREFSSHAAGIPSRLGIARLALAGNDLSTALSHLEAAAAAIETARAEVRPATLRATYLATQHQAFELLLTVYLRLNRVADALHAGERAHARALLELMAQARAGELENDNAPARLPNIQAALHPKEALLHYFMGKDNAFLFVVTRSKVQPFRLASPSHIQMLAAQLRQWTATPGRRNFTALTQASRKLGEVLLDPAMPLLQGMDSITVVGDGAIHYVPFAMLRSGDSYLIQRFQISYAPSASILVRLRAAPRISAAENWVGFGDPTPLPRNASGVAWPRLDAARSEVAAIAKLFPPHQTSVLIGKEATESALKKLPAAGYLHFAVHGRLDGERPESSALVLAPSPGEDGLLRVEEIARLRLKSRLAVLAACDSGMGPLQRGEGILGLTRAFLHAGAAQVLVTLWPVTDQSAGRAMTKFYQRLRSGESVVKALRFAQLEMLADPATAHPHHWASFVLNGDEP